MNQLEIDIENYQIIRKAKLIVNDGVTAIVGTSNHGKSAIIRAISDALFNKVTEDKINDGAKSCRISFKSVKGEVIYERFRTGANKTRYTINGEEFVKVGKVQFAKVLDVFNLQEVKFGSESVKLNFWKQMEKPFLMDKTAFQLFNFFSLSSDNEKLISVKSLMQSDLDKIKNDLTKDYAKLDIAKLNYYKFKESFELYESLKPVADEVISLETSIKVFNELKKIESDYNLFNNNLKVVSFLYSEIQNVNEVNLDSLSDSIFSFDKLKLNIESYFNYSNELNLINKSLTSIDKLEVINLSDLDSVIDNYTNVESLNSVICNSQMALQIINNLLDSLKSVSKVDLKKLDGFINIYNSVSLITPDVVNGTAELKLIENVLNKLSTVSDLELNTLNVELSNYNSIMVIYQYISQKYSEYKSTVMCLSEIDLSKMNLSELNEQVSVFDKVNLLVSSIHSDINNSNNISSELELIGKSLEDVNEKLKEIKVCPLCNKVISEGLQE